MSNEVERRQEGLDAELNKMDKAYRNKLEGYQQRGATMTEEQAAAARKILKLPNARCWKKTIPNGRIPKLAGV
ncbi:hypothetical protein KRR40_08555 [Niabella defluvii]|nr:hypothetical protein KRR40_08555 [Niabella sp. I65]